MQPITKIFDGEKKSDREAIKMEETTPYSRLLVNIPQ